MRICRYCGYADETDEKFCPICGEVFTEAHGTNLILHENPFKHIDNMSGEEFEMFCCQLLYRNGYTGIQKTKISGDHGADILTEKDGISYAIQCKCYQKPVGNCAIQEIFTAKSLYRKDIGVLMTNQICTKQAIEEAKSLNIKIWDRKIVSKMLLFSA